MKNKNVHPIRYVAGRCGLKPHLIRTWERRYQAIEPERTPTNRRLYTEKDIQRLQLLVRAVNAGHAISQVAGLPDEALRDMLAPSSASRQRLQNAGQRAAEKEISAAFLIDAGVKAVLSLDPHALEKILVHAAIAMSRPRLILDFIEPLFQEIGNRWAGGEMRVINEHMATVVVRAFLWDLLKSVETIPGAPQIIISTPAGQWHEIGALTIAVTAAETGWKTLYLGPNLPVEEIAAAVDYTSAEAVGLSISNPVDIARITSEIHRLHRYLNRDIEVFVGGQASASLGPLIENIGIHEVADLLQFRRMLETLLCKGRDGICQ